MLTSDQLKVVSICQHRTQDKTESEQFFLNNEILREVLYCTVLYFTVLHCTVLYCTVLFCTLLLPDAGAGLEDVEVLENVGDSHQPQGAEEPQPDPGPG